MIRGLTAGGGSVTSVTLSRRTALGLIEYDNKLQPQPMLAESWDVSKDFKQIKLNLRKGVQFHSGRELTSDDVKYNVLRARDPKVGAGQFNKQSNWFSTIDTPDKYTVV